MKLPAAHCAFAGCRWIGSSKASVEEHVVCVHGAQLLVAEEAVSPNGRCFGSSLVLAKNPFKLNMFPSNAIFRCIFMGLYRQAIEEIERLTVPIDEHIAYGATSRGPTACQGVYIYRMMNVVFVFQDLQDN